MYTINEVHNINVFDLLSGLPDKSVDLVYGDPDYGVGIDYSGMRYTTIFNDYMSNYINLAKESFRVLKDSGNAFFINYPRNNAFLWANCLDGYFFEVFEYVWIYNTNIGFSKNRFTTAHRSILHCRKSKNSVFYNDNVLQPYKNLHDKRIKHRIEKGITGRHPYSWLYADLVKNVTKNKNSINHPCVIPEKVSKLLIESTTNVSDLVLILFAGSGSEIEVCKKIKRNFISAELNEEYCKIINSKSCEDII